ncbi:MAG: FAD-dependent thymidylate synthase [Akkermansia sp.]|nr:FAD-dependent thymidylate synthase [Akkermansia sp.]
MNVTLIRFTPEAEWLCGYAAAKCYNGSKPDRSLANAMDGGHLSVTEHATFTFEVEGVSRVLLAQLTRHRLASYSVQSQRYISLDNKFRYVVPKAIRDLGLAQVREFEKQMEQMHKWYCIWQNKLGGPGEKANEDARFILPQATATSLIVTMNARELMHFFELRCYNRAQWEIREMADAMLRECKLVAPDLFRNAGPGCVRQYCPEGQRGCGYPRTREDWA